MLHACLKGVISVLNRCFHTKVRPNTVRLFEGRNVRPKEALPYERPSECRAQHCM
ncbi:hypothetical protein BDV25DRAFT_149169 [Aspergillus avenaceus]|uniref:Uncharacterized protein n=1 Tax=Aspergillus avenaceus TaxID=36643 RepID=A0A5N6U4R2_ASPAV|nr:hypothetical protein BDV25DRAFT_149169 [Aspergillus avenaceus]